MKLARTGMYRHVPARTSTNRLLPAPTVTYWHVLPRIATYLHILTLLAGGGRETVEPDAPPLGHGRIKL